jgi:hypothetical protein
MSAITTFETKFDFTEDTSSPEFYCQGQTSNLVMTVSNVDLKDKFIAIYCDGDMLLEYNGETIRDCYELVDNGITNDSDLSDIFNESEPGSQVIMNPWFDLYDQDGEHLDMIFHDIYLAMEEAKTILFKMQREEYDKSHNTTKELGND